MSFDVGSLVFRTETSELLAADQALTQLGVSAEKMAKKVVKAAEDATESLKELGAAAGGSGGNDSPVSNPASPLSPQGARKSVDAIEKQTLAMKILRGETIQLGDSILDMGNSFSGSQANRLAFLALSGRTTDELERMAKSFKDYSVITGIDPFDKSASGAAKMAKELNELKNVNRLATQGMSLTRQELIDYMREQQRIVQIHKSVGSSLTELKANLRENKEEYMQLSASLNVARANAKEQEIQTKRSANAQIQAAKDQDKANAELITSMSRLDNIMAGFGTGMNKASSDSLVKFQNALKISGKTVEEQTVLLDRYRIRLAQVQDAQDKQKVQYIQRAIGPQLTDIGVGLATGAPVFTTLLQQTMQMRDQFALAGVDGAKMAGVMRTAMSEMAMSIKTTALAMGSLFVGAVTDAGTAVMKYFGQASANAFLPLANGAKNASEALQYAFLEMTKGKVAADTYRASITGANASVLKLSEGAIKLGGAITGIGLLGVVTMLGLFAKAAWDASTANLELSKALQLTGASFRMNSDQAQAMAKSLETSKVTSYEVVQVMTEMAKQGGFTSSSIKTITASTLELARATGMSIGDIVKEYKELEKDPLTAIAKVSGEMGKISASTIYQIAQLQSMGEKSKAVALAQEALAKAQSETAKQIIKDWGPIDTMLDWLGKKWSSLMNNLKSDFKSFSTQPIVMQIGSLEDQLKALNRQPEFLKDTVYKGTISEVKEQIGALNEQLRLNSKAQLLANEQQEAAVLAGKGATKQASLYADAQAAAQEKMGKTAWVQAELLKTYSKEEQARLRTIGSTSELIKLQDSLGSAYDRMQSKKNKGSTSTTPVKTEVDTVALLRSQYTQQQQVIESALQLQLDTYSRYRKFGLSQTTETADEESKAIEAGLSKSLAALKDYGTQANAALMKERLNTEAAFASRKKTDANDTARVNALNNITRKQEELNSYLSTQRALLSDRSMSRYLDDILAGGKAVADFSKVLKDANREEENLRAKRHADSSSAMSNLFASPEQAAYLKGYYEELNRIQTKQTSMSEALTKATDDVTKSQLALNLAMNSPSTRPEDVAKLQEQYNALSTRLNELTSGYALFKAGMQGGAELQGEAEKLKYYQEQVLSFIKTTEGDNYLDKLNSGFTSAGDAIGTMVSAMQELTRVQEAYNKSRADMAKQGNAKDIAALDIKYAKAKENFTIKQIGTVKKYFGEQTAGYKILDKVEKGYRVKQAAETAKEYAIRFGLIKEETFAKIAGWVAGANASVGAAATSIASLLGIGSAAGAVAPVVAAAGTPGPAAFVAFAAMAALVAKAGFGAGNSSSVSSWNNTGTGTVLGDTSAKSESMKNALSKLEDVSSKTMQYSSGMLASLKVIESNTAGLATLLVRSGAASSGEFGITEGTQTTTLSKLIGINYGSFLPIVGGLISKVANSLFGKKTTINSQGLMAQTGQLGSIFGEGLTGGTLGLQNYVDITTKKKAFGITYSSNSSTQTTAASAETADQFSKIILGFVDSIKLAGKGLGVSTETIVNNLEGFNLDLGKIDLKGLTGTEIQEKLEAVFGALGDKMAQAAMGGLVDFQQVGEGYFETLVRVSSAVEESGLILKKLGIASIGYNDVLNKQGDVAAEIVRQSLGAVTSLTGVASVLSQMTGTADEIASAFGVMTDAVSTLKFIGVSSADVTYNLLASVGGFDSLSSAMSAFRENYLTDAQKIQYTSQELSKQFAALGLAMPTSGAGFVSLVQGIDATTTAGQSLLGSVLGLSDAFSTVAAEYTRVQEERLDLESQILSLQGKTSELRAIELAKLDPTNRALQEQIYLLQDQAKATEELTSALSAAGTAITTEINRLRNAATGTSTESLATLQAKFAVSTAAARSGDLTALAGLTDLSQSVETAAIASASTSAQVNQMRAWLASSLETTASGLGLDLSGLTTGTSTTSSTNVVTATTSGLSTTSTSSLIDVSGLLAELQSLRTEVQGLRTEVVAGVQHEAKISRILDRVTQDGENVTVRVVT